MIFFGYFDGQRRCGILAYRETAEGMVALGGFDPYQATAPVRAADNLFTIVSTDEREETYEGWLHPDEIFSAWHVTGQED